MAVDGLARLSVVYEDHARMVPFLVRFWGDSCSIHERKMLQYVYCIKQYVLFVYDLLERITHRHPPGAQNLPLFQYLRTCTYYTIA